MSLKASHILVSILIFSALVSILISTYDDVQQSYQTIPYNTTESNVLIKLNDLNLENSINTTIVGFQKILAPDSPFDILGGLKAASTGGFETMKILFTAPIKILNIANKYLHIPPYIIAIIGIILFVYVMFILINIKTQGDN